MRRLLSVFALVLAASPAWAQIEFKPASSDSTYLGYQVQSYTTTISAVRSRTLFSNPLEVVAAQSGYAYHVIRCVFSHPAGTNHTTTSVTGIAVTRDNGVQLCGVTTANIYADNNAQTSILQGSGANTGNLYTAITLAASANLALQVRTIGADLSGSGTFATTVILDYVAIPIPIP